MEEKCLKSVAHTVADETRSTEATKQVPREFAGESQSLWVLSDCLKRTV